MNYYDENFVIPLDSPKAANKYIVGGKAVGLYELIKQNFPVPKGKILTIELFKQHPEHLEKAVQQVLTDLSFPVAVRSSAINEDGENSYAGIYKSVLNLNSFEQVVEAVKTVRESVKSERVAVYNNNLSKENEYVQNDIAVIIQEYIVGVSGVGYSVNINTGFPDIIIESSFYPEGVTDGCVIPDQSHYIVETGKPVLKQKSIQPKCGYDNIEEIDKQSLTDEQELKIAEIIINLSVSYEKEKGTKNIDVEFSVDQNNRIWLLQIRPLNNVPIPSINPMHTGIDVENVDPKTEKVLIDGISSSTNPCTANGRLVFIESDAGYVTETDLYKVAREGKIQKGDIVVTSTVNLSWVILFSLINGLIVERGSETSHAAAMAREFGIPCISGTKNVKELKKFEGKVVTIDSLNCVVYEGKVSIITKPLDKFLLKSACDYENRGDYDRREPSHWILTRKKKSEDDEEFVRKPVHLNSPLEFQLNKEAWNLSNSLYPQYIPIKIKNNNLIYADYKALHFFMQDIKNRIPFEFFKDRQEIFKKLIVIMSTFKITYASLNDYFNIFTHYLMHAHHRAGYRRGVILPLKHEIMKKLPAKIRNIVNYHLLKNMPCEWSETRQYDLIYRNLICTMSDYEKFFFTEFNKETIEANIKVYFKPLREKMLNNILTKYKISRQQLDDMNFPIQILMLNLIEKMTKDIGIVDKEPPKAKVVRPIDGFRAFLNVHLKPFILEASPSFDWELFVNILVTCEEALNQVDLERHLHHRFQQELKQKLLDYAKNLVKAGYLTNEDEILLKSKDEILNLVYCKENSISPAECISMPDKEAEWKESIDKIELHITNNCNLSKENCCSCSCTYKDLHTSKFIFPFKSLGDIAKFNPKLVYLSGGGEPTTYMDEENNFSNVILRLRELLPTTEFILGTNGTNIPKGNWIKELSSVRIGLHGYTEDGFKKQQPKHLMRTWDNIWHYFTSELGELWVTFRYDNTNYLQCFSLIERLWERREELCKLNPSLYKTELWVKMLPLADDSKPEDPFHLSNLSFKDQVKWSMKCYKFMHGKTPFAQYYQKCIDGFIDTGFIMPQEFLTGQLPVNTTKPVKKCLPVTNYLLIAADGNFYPCAQQLGQGKGILLPCSSSVDEVLQKRREHYENNTKQCNCRLHNAFMIKQIIEDPKKQITENFQIEEENRINELESKRLQLEDDFKKEENRHVM